MPDTGHKNAVRAAVYELNGSFSRNNRRSDCLYVARPHSEIFQQIENACGKLSAVLANAFCHRVVRLYKLSAGGLAQFARQIVGSTKAVSSVPGNHPYKKAGGAGLVPTVSKGCLKCGVCADNCPVKAIDSVKFTADSKKCISCMRCVKKFPHNARKVNGALVSLAAMAIKKGLFGQKRK